MRSRLTALTVVLAAGLAGCQRADESASDTGATTLTVYASLPLQGPAGPDSQAAANGARLALSAAGGKAGELVIKLAVLDDSTPKAARWTPEQAAANARIAVRDRTTIAYLGDGPSGATAVSLPILNAAGIPQVSPTSGYQGLTGTQDADKGEPDKYYPSGVRSFARPIPDDGVQARAMLESLGDAGCRRVEVLDDRDVAGRGLGVAVAREAKSAGLEVSGGDGLRAGFDPGAVAARVAEGDADCVVFAGALGPGVPELFDALHAADPQLELFGGDGVASDAFARALAAGTQARTHLTAPPGLRERRPEVQAFARRYAQTFGVAGRDAALYGYDAMRLVLAAIARAGASGNDRAAVTRALFAAGKRSSPLGAYRIDRDGDASRIDYSLLKVRDGRLVLRRTGAF